MRIEKAHAVENLLEIYKAAVLAKDIEAFIAIYDDEVEVFDMWGAPWIYQGGPSWRAMVSAWFAGLGEERVQVEMEVVRIKQMQTAGFVSAFVRYTALSITGDSLRSLQNRLTWVVESKQGVWKIIHEHTSAPIDHATLRATLGR